MKRVIVGILLALSIAVGSVGVNPEPAAATTLAPYTYSGPVTYFGCTMFGDYGNYGVGYARGYIIGDGCNSFSSVTVHTTQASIECNVIAALYPPIDQFCYMANVGPGGTVGPQANAAGAAWGMTLGLCPKNTPPPPYVTCYRPGYSVYG